MEGTGGDADAGGGIRDDVAGTALPGRVVRVGAGVVECAHEAETPTQEADQDREHSHRHARPEPLGEAHHQEHQHHREDHLGQPERRTVAETEAHQHPRGEVGEEGVVERGAAHDRVLGWEVLARGEAGRRDQVLRPVGHPVPDDQIAGGVLGHGSGEEEGECDQRDHGDDRQGQGAAGPASGILQGGLPGGGHADPEPPGQQQRSSSHDDRCQQDRCRAEAETQAEKKADRGIEREGDDGRDGDPLAEAERGDHQAEHGEAGGGTEDGE